MTIDLSEERRAELIRRLQGFHQEEFDEELSEFRANQLLDWCVEYLAPPVYNQAVQDVRRHLQGRLDDLEGDVYISEAF